ncbi:RNA-binding domain-containing protein [Prevotella lacticifex]|uniref:ATPase AAA n=1 Tax=Prevotella lacticifex TaxID=2854755 RepID=A0A9R1CC76_9BACT|nr:RNA-binding domain-containing protein [Prevotella lacticifex]GJG36439.1 ATPase AAA [Prevotella lacticifex]GJG38298.1 ATPase AAA [Prevotella lacticifex]GJG43019.1 ATPase AAA [Prevotella lacticifex]GJG44655.1 ATPase AAA [Prevotella lacticifex]GJG49370.1 ATPase AAA [Prevotella lacticifex]
MSNKKFIAECTTYDFKQALERRKVKSWLKSVSAFANTEGGSLFFGVADDGSVIGLDDVQSDAEFISEIIKTRIDPIPDMVLTPFEREGKHLLEVAIKPGQTTPYYYYENGARTAFVRVGNESVECNSQQLLSLVLRGSGHTWDSLKSQEHADKYSFRMLANTYEKRTHQQWNDKLIESFGLVTSDGYLTNAGLLFADNCPVYQSRSFCTRWTGLQKDDAINDSEYQGNLIYLLEMTTSFIRANTATRWYKLPTHRMNIPEYSDRAILEAVVNHLIHRDYIVMGSELHVDIYDNRIEFYTPGGMYDGGQPIQNRDIDTVPSRRRNPVIADVFAQLDYMEKRGSGLKKMQNLESTLPTYKGVLTPTFRSDPHAFFTTFRNVNYGLTDDDFLQIIGDHGEGVIGVGIPKTTPKGILKGESSPETSSKGIPKQGIPKGKAILKRGILKPLGKTAQLIIDMMVSDPTSTTEDFAAAAHVSIPAIKKHLKNLTEKGIITRVGAARGGFWKVLNPNKDQS